MSAIQMRGYVLLSAAAYLRNAAGSKDAERVIGELAPQAQRALETAKQASWCAAEDVATVYRAIALLSKGDEDRTRDKLIECGQYTAREASNTFLKLLMKLLTPAIFAKKLPDLWARDCTGGKIKVDVQADRITNQLVDMGGFDHIAPVAVGYVKFALEAMGKSITKTTLHGWSLQQPGPDTASFEICWKA
jgi:hypothetical protein